ncbi:flagellar assembly protein FliH [Domibacillus epiphyticus]|uniref:Flagellar assembly protein FliH n=1 Tax=Domibacillus epiphyticus TaxID=1714355 RepID=A0A1V2ACB5_9BACI|nr:flagellar assembly protein FliH [Domibacillus epiphyticus]OMP68600.1 flagellar assembly protein FliH [Domibacillus epiphyticus]
MSNVIRTDNINSEEKTKRIIGIKPIFTDQEEEENTIPDFEQERSAVIYEANSEARSIIERAEEEKQRIMNEAAAWQSDWEKEKERIQLEAYQNAFEQGAVEGRETGYRETSSHIEEARAVVDASKVEYEKNVERSEQTILDLALVCAEKILRVQLTDNNEMFMGIVKSAIKEVREQKEVQIHVHPARYSFVVSQKDEIEALFPGDINCYIFPNEEADEEACFVETASGRIDASIDAQLQQLRKTLFDILERE